MILSDIMVREVVTVGMDDTLETIRSIFDRFQFHHVVVVSKGRVVGVISDRDILKHLSPFVGKPLMERAQDTNTLHRRAHQIMNRQPVVGREDMPVEEAASLLLDQKVSCLPVVDNQIRLRGIVTWRDLLTYCRYCDTSCNDRRAA